MFRRFFLTLCGILLVGVAVSFWYFYLITEKSKIARKSFLATGAMQNMCFDVTLATSSKSDFFSALDIDGSLFTARDFYRLLASYPEFSGIVKFSDYANGFPDPWGHDYFMRVEKSGNSSRIVIWSFGPNGRNDHGASDDIVIICDTTGEIQNHSTHK